MVKLDNKSYRFLRVVLKRLRKEKKVIERLLKSNERYSQDANIFAMLSGCKLNEASNMILSKIEEQRLKELF